MAKFGEVFSTTLKVILALGVIGVAGGMIYGVIAIATSNKSSPGYSTSSRTEDDVDPYDVRADQRHTKMPKTQWSKIVDAAVKQHCPFEGMTKDEVERALGKPKEVSTYSMGDTWKYEKVDPKKCVRFDGDKCAENAVSTRMLMFSPQGHLKIESCTDEPFYARYGMQLP